MRIFNLVHNHTVTALFITVLICLQFTAPLRAQEQSLDQLFEELKQASVEQSVRIEDKIDKLWSKTGSAAMDLLLTRGRDALENGNATAAIDHFSALVDHAPDFAQGYSLRAAAYYSAGYIGPALADIRTAVVLNPRHFGALTGLGALYEEMEQSQKALAAYQRVLELSPQKKEVQEAIKRLLGAAL